MNHRILVKLVLGALALTYALVGCASYVRAAEDTLATEIIPSADVVLPGQVFAVTVNVDTSEQVFVEVPLSDEVEFVDAPEGFTFAEVGPRLMPNTIYGAVSGPVKMTYHIRLRPSTPTGKDVILYAHARPYPIQTPSPEAVQYVTIKAGAHVSYLPTIGN